MFQVRRALSEIFKSTVSQTQIQTQITPRTVVLHSLKNRCLIRAAGEDASVFLQGLITNDIKHLDTGPGGMFTMFLNSQGRVLYDSIIYRTNEDNTFFIECDTEGAHALQKHLKMYRLRRKVDIASVSDEYEVFALLDPNVDMATAMTDAQSSEGMIVACDQLFETSPNKPFPARCFEDFMLFRDPRIVHLGSRVISRKGIDVISDLKTLTGFEITINSEKGYRYFRYMLGVGEGVIDLPPGECFPLECNCDYLHGVSFHKGCYIGQEVTARTHHTGVVRKRLMPLHFKEALSKVPDDKKIVVNGVNLGKLRGVESDIGLGLIRIAKALELKEIIIGDGVAEVIRPLWWPIEAPKERFGTQNL